MEEALVMRAKPQTIYAHQNRTILSELLDTRRSREGITSSDLTKSEWPTVVDSTRLVYGMSISGTNLMAREQHLDIP